MRSHEIGKPSADLAEKKQKKLNRQCKTLEEAQRGKISTKKHGGDRGGGNWERKGCDGRTRRRRRKADELVGGGEKGWGNAKAENKYARKNTRETWSGK